MQDNNLVPKSAAGINGRHVADAQIKVRQIVRDVWPYGRREHEGQVRILRPIRS